MPRPCMALSVKRQEHNRSLHTHTHTHRGGEDFLLKKQDGKDQEGRKSTADITGWEERLYRRGP
jgi:hypothetical protein